MPIWRQKDGTKIKVEDMKDGHLLFADRMIRNQIIDCQDMETMSYGPFAPQGEIASEDFDRCLDDAFEKLPGLLRWEKVFAKEIKRRGLKPLETKKPFKNPKIKSVQNFHGATIYEFE